MRGKLTVPVWTDRLGHQRGGCTYDVELVATIPAEVEPVAESIYRWYGTAAPDGAFRPAKFDRLVFQRAPDDYIVVPDAPRNRGLWQPDSE